MASQRYRQRQRQRQRQCNGDQRDTGEKFAEHQMQRLDRRRHEEFEGARAALLAPHAHCHRAVDDDDTVADRLHFLKDMRGQNDSGSPREILYQLAQMSDLRGIEAVRGFVEFGLWRMACATPTLCW